MTRSQQVLPAHSNHVSASMAHVGTYRDVSADALHMCVSAAGEEEACGGSAQLCDQDSGQHGDQDSQDHSP